MSVERNRRKRMKLLTCAVMLLGGLLVIAAPSWAENQSPVQEFGAFKRVAPETSTEGMTVDKYFERQNALHGWLKVETPGGSLADPLAIELTQKELDEINNVDTSQIGPVRVGVVKELDQPVTFSCSQLSRSGGAQQAAAACGAGGALEMTEDGGFRWARAITSAGAVGIRVHVTGLSLPART